jgi:hypothetical protein
MRNFPPRQVRRKRCATRDALRAGGTFSLKCFKLALNRFQIRVDCLLEETALRRVELLAAPAELPTL